MIINPYFMISIYQKNYRISASFISTTSSSVSYFSCSDTGIDSGSSDASDSSASMTRILVKYISCRICATFSAFKLSSLPLPSGGSD